MSIFQRSVVDRQDNEGTFAPVTQIVKVGTAKPTMVLSDASRDLPEYPLTTDENARRENQSSHCEEETDEFFVQMLARLQLRVQGERTIRTRVH